MEKKRLEKIKKHVRSEAAIEAGKVLHILRDEFHSSPEAMTYFYEQAEKQFTEGIIPENGKKIIAYMCIQVPEELIIAAGGQPARICSGSHSNAQFGSEYTPSKSCSMINAVTGLFHTWEFRNQIDLLVIPTTCDQKKKTAEMLSGMGYNVYPLSLPARKDDDNSRLYWQNTIREFTADLTRITGTRISASSLKKALALKNNARNEYRRFHNIRKQDPAVIYGSDAFLVLNTYFTDDIEKWTAALNKLNNELEKNTAPGKAAISRNAPRFLFTGSPPIFPNLKIPIFVEQHGGLIVTDEVCSSSRMLYDIPAFDEPALYDMIPAIADSYLKPCTCPCFVLNHERKDRITNLAQQFKVDGVIYQSFSGCHLYEMEYKETEKYLNDKGLPMLFLESDYSPEDTGQVTTRIEAFIESIKIRKKRKRD